jgi:MerR family transcriptional regulator, mercuric resistance operon regulatory protein
VQWDVKLGKRYRFSLLVAGGNMNARSTITIGVLSERTQVDIETIRYYERIGILPKPLRSIGGHRIYSNEDKRRLTFI